MKAFAFLAFFAIVAYASAASLPQFFYDGVLVDDTDSGVVRLEDVDTDAGLSTDDELPPIRHRRVTCDLLSVQTLWVTVNHAACAAKCLAQRRRGGHCVDGVCHCR